MAHQAQEPFSRKHTDVSGNKDQEVSTSTYNNMTIEPGELLDFASCGRADTASGTEGQFDIVEPFWVDAMDKNIRHFYWDCPWGSSDNTFSVTGEHWRFRCDYYGANLSGGALGSINISIWGN